MSNVTRDTLLHFDGERRKGWPASTYLLLGTTAHFLRKLTSLVNTRGTPSSAMLAVALSALAAASPQSKLQSSRMVLVQPALPKVLELRGGGMVSGDLVVKSTQAVFGGYALLCLARPDLVTRLYPSFGRALPSIQSSNAAAQQATCPALDTLSTTHRDALPRHR